jgi:hypothetical protein
MKRNCYKSHKTILSSIAMLAATTLAQGVQAATEEDLEPCINGGVSATGLYASQAEENQAKQFAIVKNSRIAGGLDLEPCINSGVSATGLYVSQRAEDQVKERQVDAEKIVAQADDDC